MRSSVSASINTISYGNVSLAPKYLSISSNVLNPTATSISSKKVTYEIVGFIVGTTYLAFWLIVESIIKTFFDIVVRILAMFSNISVLSYAPIKFIFSICLLLEVFYLLVTW